MSDVTSSLLSIIEFCKLAGPLLGILVAPLVLLRPKLSSTRTIKSVITSGLFFLFSFTLALGTGSCVLGGAIEGVGICSFDPKAGPPLDPVKDFVQLQITYFLPFVLAALLAAISLMGLLFGPHKAWPRFLHIVTLGRGGAWG
jgi:hypothetical protein